MPLDGSKMFILSQHEAVTLLAYLVASHRPGGADQLQEAELLVLQESLHEFVSRIVPLELKMRGHADADDY